MEEERRKKGDRLVNRLAERYRQPSPKDMVILHGRASATVFGCGGILTYTPDRICLRVGRQCLTLYGRDLFCAAFTGSAVTVKGRILGLEYREKNEKKGDEGEK